MNDDAIIHAALRRFDRRLRGLMAVRILLTGVAAAGLTALAAALVDRWLPLSPAVRTGVLIALAIEVIGGTLSATYVLIRRSHAVALARRAESQDAGWGERLSTVVSQAALPAVRRASTGLLAALTREVASELSQRPPVKRASPLLVWPGVMAVMLVAIAWAGAFTVKDLEVGQLLRRQMRPYAGVSPVTTTKINVLPHAMTVQQGEPMTISADIVEAAGPVTIDVGPDAGQSRSLQMRKESATRYAVTLLAVQQDFVFRIRAGDAATAPATVRVSRRPGLSEFTLALLAPDGGRSTPLPFDEGAVYVPAGAACELTLHATEPLKSATIRVGANDIAATPGSDRKTWRGRFTADADAPVMIVLAGESGIVAAGPKNLRVSVLRPATP